jgi:hypothetical protein
MSQSTVQAKLCAGKNRIGSSIQAQSPGEFMGQRWRSYDLSDMSTCCCNPEYNNFFTTLTPISIDAEGMGILYPVWDRRLALTSFYTQLLIMRSVNFGIMCWNLDN